MITFCFFYCFVATLMVVPIWASSVGNCSSQCPPNEEYKKCNLPPCAVITCDRKIVCYVISCTPGCGCLDGYIRETDGGRCVLPKDCPKKCRTNEVFDPKPYSPCPIQDPSCVDPNPRPLPHLCLVIIFSGRCVCAPGYIRFGPGRTPCIKINQCPRICRDPHAVYRECGSNCGHDCESVRHPNTLCPAICYEGCFCAPPYVLNEPTQDCVLPQNCPKLLNLT